MLLGACTGNIGDALPPPISTTQQQIPAGPPPATTQPSPADPNGAKPTAANPNNPKSIDPNGVPSIPVLSHPKVTGTGFVFFTASGDSQIIDLVTTLTVPPAPPKTGTLFLWPGLQPGGANYDPIDNGVLQPVLTWGPSCAPGEQPPVYSTWWVSAQYVNTVGHDPGFTGCQGGPIMPANVGDSLQMHFWLEGTVWHQTVLDVQTGASVAFAKDLLGQAQNWEIFLIEGYGARATADVIFTQTSMTFAQSDPSGCMVQQRGTNDYVSTPLLSPDSLHCAIETIILRDKNVPVDAATPPSP